MNFLSTRSTDQDAQLVADVVEDVWLKDASAPDPDHVLVSVDQELQPGSIPVVRDPLENRGWLPSELPVEEESESLLTR